MSMITKKHTALLVLGIKQRKTAVIQSTIEKGIYEWKEGAETA